MKHNKIFYIVITFILALIIGVSSFSIYHLKNKTNKHIDVIDIDCKDDNCEKVNEDKDTNTDNNDLNKNTNTNDDYNPIKSSDNINSTTDTPNTNQATLPNQGTKDTNTPFLSNDKRTGDFVVSDKKNKWNSQTNLKIFDVSSISPSDSGTYDFIVNNNTNSFVKYNIVFDEINEYNVNMMYKLKRNGEYISGNKDTYVKYNVLNIPDKKLNSGDKDYYTIDWKWVDAENDTEVGRAASKNKVTYTVRITVNSFEAVQEAGDNPKTGDKIITYIILLLISIVTISILVILNNKNKKKGKNEISKNN